MTAMPPKGNETSPSEPRLDARTAPRRTAVRMLAALIGAYVSLIAALALSGRFTFVWKTSVVPVLLLAALSTRQGGRFVRDWAPFLGVVIFFDCLRGLVFGVVTALQLPFYARYAIEAEEALFGGHTLPNLVQAVFLRDGAIGALEKAFVVVHGSHFFAFLVFGFAVWLLRRDGFHRFCAAMVLLLTLGITLYFAVPTVPPWMASSTFHMIPPLHHVSARVYNTVSPVLGRTFDVNPIAAMPSLHTAIPVLCSFVAWRHFRASGLAMAAYTLGVCTAIVYLGEHYYVDVVAGALLAAAVYLIVYRTAALERTAELRPIASLRVRVGRHPTLAPLAAAVLFVIAAEAVGQLGASIRRPLQLDEAFVHRELVGRSDLASLALARLALQRGDDVKATSLLEQALTEVSHESDRAAAAALLEALARRNAAPRAVPAFVR